MYRGATIDAATYYAGTALHIAAREGYWRLWRIRSCWIGAQILMPQTWRIVQRFMRHATYLNGDCGIPAVLRPRRHEYYIVLISLTNRATLHCIVQPDADTVMPKLFHCWFGAISLIISHKSTSEIILYYLCGLANDSLGLKPYSYGTRRIVLCRNQTTMSTT